MINLIEALENEVLSSAKQIREEYVQSDIPDILWGAVKNELSTDDITYIFGLMSQHPNMTFIGLDKDLAPGNNLNFSPVKQLGKTFLRKLLAEVRKLICSKEGNKELSSELPTITVSTISTTIMSSLGVTQPIALGLASLAILIIFRAAKGTICNVSDDEIMERIESNKSA